MMLCAMALMALVAIGGAAAGSAQASGFEWELVGKSLIGRNAKQTPLQTKYEGSLGITETEVAGIPVEGSCGVNSGGELIAGGSGRATLTIPSCFFNKPAKCTLASPAVLEANFVPVVIGSSDYEKFTPKTGTSFGQFTFAGAECPLTGVSVPLKGSFAGSTNLREEAINHKVLTSKPIDTELGTELKFGTKPVSIYSTFEQVVGSPFLEYPWRYIAGGIPVGGFQVAGVHLGPTESRTMTTFGEGVTFSLSSGGNDLSVKCEAPLATKSKIVGNATLEAILTFGGCHFTNTKMNGCSLGGGTSIAMGPLQGSVSYIGGEDYETFKPVSGSLFGLAPRGGECVLNGKNYTVNGSLSGIAKNLGLSSSSQVLEFSEVASSIAGSGLEIEGTPGSVSGGFQQKLFSNEPWGLF